MFHEDFLLCIVGLAFQCYYVLVWLSKAL